MKGALGEHGHLYQAVLDNQFQNQTLHSDSISSSGREKRATSFITIVTFLREREYMKLNWITISLNTAL